MQRCATYARKSGNAIAADAGMATPALPLRLHDVLLRFTARCDWLAPLLLRLAFGYFWFETGWAKLQNHAGFAARFADWGIPWPSLSAYLSGATDLIGGALLILGLGTRLATLPMIFNMLIALVVVVLPGASQLDPAYSKLDWFVELDEVLYVLVLFWLLMAGPGKASLDHLIARRFGRG